MYDAGDRHRALGTVLVSFILWGMGTPLAVTILVIYYQRLAVHKLPPREMIASCFLPLGPLGYGGFSVLYLGKVARVIFNTPLVSSASPDIAATTHPLSSAGNIFYVLGLVVALLMWSFGLIWLVFALAAVSHCAPFPFNMGWWGFTFPLGVFCTSTILLGEEMDVSFFKILGTVRIHIYIYIYFFIGSVN